MKTLSRHTDMTKVECPCGWYGTIADMEHGYEAIIGSHEVTGQDYCPICGNTIDKCRILNNDRLPTL
jgi:hypothetical protein